MRYWFSFPGPWRRTRLGVSVGPSDFTARELKIPNWRRHELRHGLQEAAKANGETLSREDADYLIDRTAHDILAAAAAEQAKRRRMLWRWVIFAWLALSVVFMFLIANAAQADERLHDGAACFNAWGEAGTWYGNHCYKG